MANELPLLPGPEDPSKRPEVGRRGGPGRPKGSRNRRSLDLARWIAATFAGLTPGQQSAAIALVSPQEIEDALSEAIELRVPVEGLSPVLAAMAVKAAKLARALGIGRGEAWVLMAKERVDLMGYVHQKQPTAEQPSARASLPTVFVVNDGDPAPALPGFGLADVEDVEIIEEVEVDVDEVPDR